MGTDTAACPRCGHPSMHDPCMRCGYDRRVQGSAAGRKYLAASPPAVGAGYVRPEQRGARQLWDEARAVSDDPAIQNQHWGRLMIANGHWRTAIWDEGVAHRILAQHGPGETCDACPCWHCGSAESDPDGDHSCPCPYHDNDCPWHRDPKERDTQ